jgi:hypothetical protein
LLCHGRTGYGVADSAVLTPRSPATLVFRAGASRIARAPRVIAVTAGDRAELLNLDTGQRIPLSEMTDRAWELLVDLPTFPGLVERLRLEYAAQSAQVARDVATTLAAWRRARLIVWQ